MEGKTLAQMGAVAFVAVAMTVAAVELTRHDTSPEALARPAIATSPDPLAAELARCQLLGEDGPLDASCLSAWAESRRRFLKGNATKLHSAADALYAPPNTTIISKTSNEPVLDTSVPPLPLNPSRSQ